MRIKKTGITRIPVFLFCELKSRVIVTTALFAISLILLLIFPAYQQSFCRGHSLL